MNPNPFVRLEATCANAIERAFAIAFPSALEPVQIARKLAGAFEAGSTPATWRGRRFIVRLHPSDYARLQNDLPYLERQWRAMLARIGERSGRPELPPGVASLADASVAAGTVTIASETSLETPRLLLRVRTGMPAGAFVVLDRSVTIGRHASCDLVVSDPRVSRRHLEVTLSSGGTANRGAHREDAAAAGRDVHFKDLDSSNGTLLNGVRVSSGSLTYGDVVSIGDSELRVDAES